MIYSSIFVVNQIDQPRCCGAKVRSQVEYKLKLTNFSALQMKETVFRMVVANEIISKFRIDCV